MEDFWAMKKTTRMTAKVTALVPPEMRDELVAHSVATGRTLTETVREALRSYLAARGEIISERERPLVVVADGGGEKQRESDADARLFAGARRDY